MFDRRPTGFIVSAEPTQEPIQTNTASEPPPSNAPSRRRRPVRGERIAVYLPPELVEDLRVRCVRERRSVSDAVTEAVASWMTDLSLG